MLLFSSFTTGSPFTPSIILQMVTLIFQWVFDTLQDRHRWPVWCRPGSHKLVMAMAVGMRWWGGKNHYPIGYHQHKWSRHKFGHLFKRITVFWSNERGRPITIAEIPPTNHFNRTIHAENRTAANAAGASHSTWDLLFPRKHRKTMAPFVMSAECMAPFVSWLLWSSRCWEDPRIFQIIFPYVYVYIYVYDYVCMNIYLYMCVYV